MRRSRLWGLGLALLLGWGAATARAGDDADAQDAKQAAPAVSDTGQRVWSSHLLHHTTPRPPRKPPKKKNAPAADKPAPKPTVPPEDEPAAVRAREEAAYLRRLEVCLKLKEIAEEKGDPALARMADDLDARAKAVYFQRIADLPASHAEPELDARLLDKHAPARNADAAPPAALPHTVPAEEAAAGHTAPGED
jgi:hypothetical protein